MQRKTASTRGAGVECGRETDRDAIAEFRHGAAVYLSLALPLVFLFAPLASSASTNGTADYIDINGNTAGFGTPTGTINQSALDWDTTSAGTGTSAAFASNDQMTFGNVSTDLSQANFSVGMTGAPFGGIAVNSTSATITLTGTTDTKLSSNQTWTVAAGSTLIDNAAGVDFGGTTVTLAGGGIIDFEVTPTTSATGVVTENGTLVVNLNEATGASPFTGGYVLTQGTLNFATAAAAGAFQFSSSSKTLSISGGTIDNTSGGPLTLSLGSGTYSIGGSFAFTGSNPLSLGAAAVSLTAPPTITINSATNPLTIGGAISGAYGITVAGGGTLILSGNNANYGTANLTTTTISSGTLQIANSASLGAGSVTIDGTTSLTSGPTLAFTLPGSSSFSNTIVLAGTTSSGLVSFISVAGGDSVTLSGNFSMKSGELCVTGGGTIILSSNGNQYSGGTIIGQTGGSSTTLSIGSFADVYSSGVVKIANGTLDWTGGSSSQTNSIVFQNTAANCAIYVASSGTLSLSNALTGSAGNDGFTNSGPGTLTISAASTYTGGTILSAGTLLLSNSFAVQDSAVSLSGGGLTFSSTVSPHAFTFGDISGSGNLALQDNATTPNPVALTVGGGNDSPTYSGALSGAGSLTKVGSGVLTLTGPNTYTGGTTITAGTLQLGNQLSTTASLSSSGGLAVNGTLTVEPAAGATITIGNSLTGSGNITVDGSSTQAATPSAVVFSGSTSGFTGSWTISGGSVQLGSANSLGAATDSIVVNGTNAGGGELSFTTGTVANPITINGIGAAESAGNLGAIRIGGGAYSGSITLGSNASISASGSTGTISGPISDSGGGYALTLGSQSTSTSGGTINITSANNSYSGGTVILGATVGDNAVGALGTGTITLSNSTSHVATTALTENTPNALTGANSLIVQAGTATLSQPNNYSGGTTLSGGTLRINNSAALGSGSLTINGGTLDNTSGSPITVSGISSIAIGGSFAFSGSSSLNLGTAPVTISATPTITLSSPNNSLTIGGAISGSGFAFAGPGMLILGGSNSSTGGTQFNGGTLVANVANSLGAGNLTVSADADGPASMVNINANQTIGGLSGTLANGAAANWATIAIAGGQTLSVNQSGTGTFPGTVNVSGTLQMQGAGTLELTGAPVLNANSAVVVSSGILRLNNVTAGTGASIGSNVTATIAAGATLQLAGTVSALSDATNPASVADILIHGAGNLLVTGTGQSVGTVIGDTTNDPGEPTTYSGSTVVGDGNNAANLTITQILGNTLTINSGSTVTILPSTSSTSQGSFSVSSESAASTGLNAAMNLANESGNPLNAFESTTSQQLENRLAIIERLAADDPRLNISVIENSLLSQTASMSPEDPNVDPISIGDSGFIGNLGSGGSLATELHPLASFGNSTPVPEPSTLLLAATAGLGFVGLARRLALGNQRSCRLRRLGFL